jgi:hypothetical protein
MLNTTNWSKSQHKILCILGYKKKTKSDILYSEQSTFQHYIILFGNPFWLWGASTPASWTNHAPAHGRKDGYKCCVLA